MRRLLFCVAMLCMWSGVSLAESGGVVAYRGKISYKCFTGLERLNGRINLILLRDALVLEGNEQFIIIDKKRKIFWTYINGYNVAVWRVNDGQMDWDIMDISPVFYIDVNGTPTKVYPEVGGYAKQKTIETSYEVPTASVVKSTLVDAFKSMPVKGVVRATSPYLLASPLLIDDDVAHDGMGWAAGSFRYNKKLTKELNTTPGILGDIDASVASLRQGLLDDNYVDGGTFAPSP